ncbi:GDSL-type esterase/lipase family protein [Blastococcus sp. CT_GayMR16]|uniref:GDSL-type esterase/lipase family protein n=1 Tax=Blastococcus sp. CT_GayMR16 TaxID=2559607 RepID=UPI0010734E3A|nr:GDSL-type esterase/lipase family protein [Blastococcus sp. CT_GayMR16]TFV85618.1 SGNH/GDSL hydrolase family protein [Blastococcus sp. CT_GayMR16]
MAPTPLRLVVLGDSIAYGTGARSPDDALGPRLSAVLADDGFDVDLHVLAVPGAVSAQLADQVRRATPLQADLAVVVIGANDLARFVPVDGATAALAAAVTALQAAGTDVVVVPAPDMSSVPFVPPAFRAAVRAACAQLQQRQGAVAEAAGAVVAHIAAEIGTAFAADPTLFSADRFHPSSAGYRQIAAALAPTVLAAARARRDGDAAA